MSDQVDDLSMKTEDDEFERLGRRAGAELRLRPPDDGPESIHRTARRRRAATVSATVAVVLAVVVGGLIAVERNRHVEVNEPSATTLVPPATLPRVELTGHTGLVVAFDISSDGRTVVTADDTTLRVWDSITGRQLREISLDAASPIDAVAFNVDGKYVGAHQVDRQAKFWAVADGSIASPFSTSWDNPSFSGGGVSGDQVVSRDGKMAVVLGRFTGARLVDAVTGAQVHDLASSGTAYTAVFSDDGAMVAVKFDRTVRVWRLAPFEELPLIDVPAYQATGEQMKFSPDGTRVAFTVENIVIIQRIGATP